MFAAGELDMALLGGNAQVQDGNAVRPLFADAIAEGRRFYDTHGYIPANHTYMVRGSLAREHPALVANLYRAFREAKTLAQESLHRTDQSFRRRFMKQKGRHPIRTAALVEELVGQFRRN